MSARRGVCRGLSAFARGSIGLADRGRPYRLARSDGLSSQRRCGSTPSDASTRGRRYHCSPNGVLCHFRLPCSRHCRRWRRCTALTGGRYHPVRSSRTPEDHAEGRFSILVESPISRCSTTDPARVFGFDTGPANAPLDRLARHLSGGELACDQDGRFARAGRINEPLLTELLEKDLFLARRPPKSTGFEMYGDAFVAQAAEQHGGV